MEALARLGLGDLYGQMPQLALDVQHWGKIGFGSHTTPLSPGTDRKDLSSQGRYFLSSARISAARCSSFAIKIP
jgi:hypothetical protein